MGIARGAIALLAQEAARRPFSGSVVTLGRQTIHASGREVQRQLSRFGVASCQPLDGQLDDQALFRALGFHTVHSIDYSDYEGATHVLDLNSGKLPDHLVGQYDVVLDSGTLEHVFHVPNALETVVKLTKVGGRIILFCPSSNHFDHGFYMFSPTLFCDYFAANHLPVDVSYVVRYSPRHTAPWKAYKYTRGEWNDVQVGGLDGRPYLTFAVASKTAQSTFGVIPQQSFYSAASAQYGGSRLAGDVATLVQSHRSAKLISLRGRVRQGLSFFPPALRAGEALLRASRRTLLGKKLIGRY